MALRWGIASAGKISSDFLLPDLKQVQKNLLKDSTSKKPTNYEGYDSLAKDNDVEVVYVGVLNPQHYEVTKLLLNHGKHVLCEKPFTMNQKQTVELVNLAKSKNLFLMEAIWSRCFPAYREIQRVIESGEIGDVLFATVDFGFPLQEVDRLRKKDLGGGAILDLGIYILQFQQFAFRGLTPTKVVANGHLNAEGVDEVVSAVITYPNSKTAVVTASAVAQMGNIARIVGSKGTIELPEFWCPTKLIVNGKQREFPLPSTGGTYNYHNSAGLANEAEEVRACIRGNKTESPQLTLNETIELSKLMDELRKQLGVVFPEDNY